MFTAARGAFIGLSVDDLDASVRWYTEKLGLRVTQDNAGNYIQFFGPR